MNTKYDFYANFQIEKKNDVDDLINGAGKYDEIKDTLTRIMLLSTIFGVKDERFPDKMGRHNRIDPIVYARIGEDNASGLKALIHSKGNYNDYVTCKLSEFSCLGIDATIDLSALPKGSWGIEFPITLAKPFISRDDVPFYVIDSLVRKDKVFGVPFTSATTWKGNLRWTMMKIQLEPSVKDPEKFAEIRFRHTLLFGTEKGREDTPTGWAKYLNELCRDAQVLYQKKLKEKFEKKEAPNLRGMLHPYSTFWDKIDMEVINPHDRKSKTGKTPIYFETVPKGSRGVFRIIYVPLHWIMLSDEELEKRTLRDLRDVVIGLKAMMLVYGFSAKKSTGYGVIKDEWDKDASKLMIKDFVKDSLKFSNFEELTQKVSRINERLNNE